MRPVKLVSRVGLVLEGLGLGVGAMFDSESLGALCALREMQTRMFESVTRPTRCRAFVSKF